MLIGLREQKSGLSRSRMKNTAFHRMHYGVMDGDGFFTKPTHLTSRWRLITRKIVFLVTSQPSQRTGLTFRVFQYSSQSEAGIEPQVLGTFVKDRMHKCEPACFCVLSLRSNPE